KDYSTGGSANSKLYLHGQNDYPLIEKNRVSVSAETTAVYIYGLNGAIAKRLGSTVLFLLKDHLGSTRVVMDATGLVRSYYDYDAFGNLIRTSTTNEVKYQFTGQEFDESGLHNYRARLYDSDLGKFYAVDAEGQFASPYAYAGNNPILVIDKDGNLAWFVPILIGAAVNSVFYAATAEQFTWQGLAGAAVSGAISGAFSPLLPAGIIPGAVSGAVVGAFANFTGAIISGGDPRSAALWGAAGGFVGGGISGGLQARALGHNLLTGKAPSLAPVPLSGAIGEIPIRSGGQSIPQSLDELDVLPSQADELAEVSIGPMRPVTSDAVRIQYSETNLIERHGLRFTEKYYAELWQTGRKAPALISNEILASKHFQPIPVQVANRPGQQFFLYRAISGSDTRGWELVFNPVTKEVYHLQQVNNVVTRIITQWR
ncbi:MAG: RHS repeat domain-containing protein, partial [bacterium]